MQSGNMSMASETSSKFNEESRMKIDILMSAFEELGWDSQKDLTQKEILLFLNRLSKQGQFDQTLAQKLFQVLDVNNQNQITVEEFIKGYLQFEADLKKNNDEFNKKYIQEQNNYNNLEENTEKLLEFNDKSEKGNSQEEGKFDINDFFFGEDNDNEKGKNEIKKKIEKEENNRKIK